MNLYPAAAFDAEPTCRPLRWWTGAQLRCFVDQVRASLDGWARDWECTLGALGAWNTSDQALPAQTGIVWSRIPCEDAQPLYIGATGLSAWRVLCQTLFDVAARTTEALATDSMACSLARRACHELVQALATASGVRAPRVEDLDLETVEAPPEDQSRPWLGAARMRISLGRNEHDWLWLHLPEPVVSRCLPRPAAAQSTITGSLVKSTSAVERKPLRLHVGLSPVSLDLGSLLGLRLGDVITTSHRLDRPLLVSLQKSTKATDMEPLCAGLLGGRGEQKAIALDFGAARERAPAPAVTGTPS